MEILELMVICIVALFSFTKYTQHTTEQALNKRWKFVKFMQPILKSNDYTPEFKKLILSIFNDSMQRNFLPKVIVFGLIFNVFNRKKYKQIQSELQDDILQNDEHQYEQYKKAIMLMMEVNFYNAPHWYVIVGFLPIVAVVIFSIFAKVNQLITKTFLETLVFRAVRPQYQTY